MPPLKQPLLGLHKFQSTANLEASPCCQTLADYLPPATSFMRDNLMSGCVIYKVAAEDTGDMSLRRLPKSHNQKAAEQPRISVRHLQEPFLAVL